jgi:hypothetical protein
MDSMSAGLISLMFTVGAATWIYTKLQRISGNNTKQSLIAASIAGAMMFIVVYSIFNLLLK